VADHTEETTAQPAAPAEAAGAVQDLASEMTSPQSESSDACAEVEDGARSDEVSRPAEVSVSESAPAEDSSSGFVAVEESILGHVPAEVPGSESVPAEVPSSDSPKCTGAADDAEILRGSNPPLLSPEAADKDGDSKLELSAAEVIQSTDSCSAEDPGSDASPVEGVPSLDPSPAEDENTGTENNPSEESTAAKILEGLATGEIPLQPLETSELPSPSSSTPSPQHSSASPTSEGDSPEKLAQETEDTAQEDRLNPSPGDTAVQRLPKAFLILKSDSTDSAFEATEENQLDEELADDDDCLLRGPPQEERAGEEQTEDNGPSPPASLLAAAQKRKLKLAADCDSEEQAAEECDSGELAAADSDSGEQGADYDCGEKGADRDCAEKGAGRERLSDLSQQHTNGHKEISIQ
jgi:hypothetical protein